MLLQVREGRVSKVLFYTLLPLAPINQFAELRIRQSFYENIIWYDATTWRKSQIRDNDNKLLYIGGADDG